jgi:DNA-binding protein Fis
MNLVIDIDALLIAHDNHEKTEGAYKELIRQVDINFFKKLVIYSEGNQAKSARIAGLNRRTIARKLTNYNLAVIKELRHL